MGVAPAIAATLSPQAPAALTTIPAVILFDPAVIAQPDPTRRSALTVAFVRMVPPACRNTRRYPVNSACTSMSWAEGLKKPPAA